MLRSEEHELLYQQLSENVRQVRIALLDADDPETLSELVRKHQNIMQRLGQAGFSRNPKLMNLIQEIKCNVDTVIDKAQKQKADTARRLKASGNKRRLTAAYGRHS